MTELPSPCLTGWPGRTSTSLPGLNDCTFSASYFSMSACVRPTFAQSCDAYQLRGRSLTNRWVSWRKSNTVTGPCIRGNKVFRPSGVNSPLPEARSWLNPVVAVFSPLLSLGRSLVVQKVRGPSFASFRSISQIKTGGSADAAADWSARAPLSEELPVEEQIRMYAGS